MNSMKKCQNCQNEKMIKEFSEQKSRGKIYVNNVCIECMRKKQKEYREGNKVAKNKTDKEYYHKIKLTPKFILAEKERRNNNKVHKQEYDKKYREDHKEEYRKYCIENKEKIAKIRNRFYIEHKDERAAYNKCWVKNNRVLVNKSRLKYVLKRIKIDINFKLRKAISKTINRYLKLNNSSKGGKSCLKFLPYTMRNLKDHLEKLFEPWMMWKNYGTYRAD